MRNYADITQSEKEIIKGLLIGDGSIAGGNASPGADIYFGVEQSKRFLKYIGDPPPGFGHKWSKGL